MYLLYKNMRPDNSLTVIGQNTSSLQDSLHP